MTTLIGDALACSHCLVSVMGDHAGESPDAIFNRKMADIEKIGKTFWLIRSPKVKPEQVQGVCTATQTYAIFVQPATKGGARPTKEEDPVKEYSTDRVLWNPLFHGISPVTGKLDSSAAAFVFDQMTTDVSGTLDLWNYGELSDINRPLRFILGCSTVCAVRKDTKSHPGRMKSRYRGIVAVARLATPYCVWVR